MKEVALFAAVGAIAIACMGTAYVQARVGSAGVGAITEKPELAPQIFVLMALPETILLFGFVIAIMIMQKA